MLQFYFTLQTEQPGTCIYTLRIIISNPSADSKTNVQLFRSDNIVFKRANVHPFKGNDFKSLHTLPRLQKYSGQGNQL